MLLCWQLSVCKYLVPNPSRISSLWGVRLYLKMAFRVIKQRREARRFSKINELNFLRFSKSSRVGSLWIFEISNALNLPGCWRWKRYLQRINSRFFTDLLWLIICFIGNVKSFALVIDLQNTLILKESETISVDDVADIFKMYGVDYKEVKI